MEKMLFVHIPKTAGQTFTSILDEVFIDKSIFSGQLVPEFLNCEINKLKDYHLLRGHVSYCFLQYCLQLPLYEYFICTFLREPIARKISAYRHAHRVPELANLRWDNLQFNQVNAQVNFLSTLPRQQGPYTTRQHLESAKETLKTMSFFGITERFDESINLFCSKIHRPDLRIEPRKVNVATNKQLTVNDAVIENLKETEWADIELYNYALELFGEKSKPM